jgi:hypothetical protein
MPETDDRSSTPPDAPATEPPGSGEFVFRFRVDPSTLGDAVYGDPLLELIRGQLADLLDAVTLTDHGRPVRVTGFRLLQEPDREYEIFPQEDATSPPRSLGDTNAAC